MKRLLTLFAIYTTLCLCALSYLIFHDYKMETKTYRFAITYISDRHTDTVTYYYTGENRFFLHGGCFQKFVAPKATPEDLICGVKSFELVSIHKTPITVKIVKNIK